MEQDSECLKLPIDERCQHKLWKARVSGYEAATKLFQGMCDEKSPEWGRYLGLVKKFAVDSNAVAQEKGLDAVLAFVENAGCAGKTCGEVMGGLVGKCLGAPKVRTKEKAVDIILMYVEIERAEVVQDELIRGFGAKTPKVVAACVQVLRDALHSFGPKIITLKPLVKQLPALLEDRDKGVRDEAKLLTVEIYRWIGTALKPQLATLKPVQLTELESEFAKITPGRAEPSRFIRSQQALQAKASKKSVGPEDDEEDDSDYVDAAVDIDPYELLQSVDILSQLPKDFYEKCEAKKWQERKEAVDLLQPLAANPKLENGDYGDLVRALKKIVSKDTNVMVVAVAGKCLADLAAGLKKRFTQYVGQCFPIILEKFKEKKQNVVVAMREAADAMFTCTTLEAIQEDILSSLESKNPPVKVETASFMARAFCKCDPVALNKKLLKVYSAALLKILMNDPDLMVRDAAAEALGTAMKVVGEKVMTPFIVDLDNIKMAKVKDCCERAQVVAAKDGTRPKKVAGTVSETNSRAMVAKPASEDRESPRKSVPGAAPRKPVPGGGKGSAKPSGKTKKTKPAAASEVVEKELTSDEVDEQAAAVLPTEVISGLADSNWKARLAAMEQFSESVRVLSRAEIPTQALVRTLVKKPGFKENNFQVLKLKLEALTFLASNANFTRRSMECVIEELAEKIGDPKNGGSAATALTAIAEATKLDVVSTQVLDFVFSQKNPKNQSEAMNWLSGAIKEFGFLIQVKPVIDNVKKALAATNPAVRTSAITLLGVMYMYMGGNLRMLFENEKAALLQQIDVEFEKLQGVVPPPMSRGLAPPVTGGDNDDGEIVSGQTSAVVPNICDLIPSTDISAQLTSTLLGEMGDKNWKVRLEALQKLATIINEVKFITPNLADLPNVFKARMVDSNKNLATQALSICQSIGTGMGSNCSRYIRILGPAMITSLGDSKNTVRCAAASCLNAWVTEAGLVPFFEGEMLSDALKLDNPNLRVELLGWLSEHLPQAKAVPTADLALCLPYLYAALEDRNVDVRKKAQDVVLPFMVHLGYEQMARQASKLKPASKTQVMAALDKAKPSLPARPPPPTSKAVRGGGNKASSPPAANDLSNGSRDDGSDTGQRAQASAPPKQKMKRASSKTRVGSKVNSAAGKKKDEEVDTSAPMVVNNLKDQRISDEQRLKVLKWNFVTPRDEFYELLREQMAAAGFNRALLANLFHNDFKFHLRSLDTFFECLESAPEATVANLDLVLKWLALRFFDTNPSVLLKGLEYVTGLFQLLAARVYQLHEYEAASFLPYLVLKVGDSKDPVRQTVRAIFKLVYRIYPACKMFVHLMEGLKVKNARQRSECLDELGFLIEMYGMVVCQPNPATCLRELARHISDRDNGVRSAALNCIVQAYYIDNEKVYKYVGPISDKDMGLLEERIKRASKNRPAIQPPPVTQVAVSPHIPKAPSPESRSRALQPSPGNVQTLEEQMAVIRRVNANRGPCSRPVSGAFSLDLDKMEPPLHDSVDLEIPKLLNHDIDEIFNEPIKLPVTKMHPPSPAAKILKSSVDAASAMDLVISQVASNDVCVGLQASVQLDEFLKEEGRAEALANRVDQLLVAASLQYRMIYTKHMGDDATSKADVLRLYRCLTMMLFSVFNYRCLAQRVSKDVLRDLVHNLLTILLDARLAELTDGGQIVRTINLFVVKMVERSDHTNMLSALIRLLHDCVANDNSAAKFTELVMKCLWKLVRMFPKIIDGINLDRVLLDLHLFLRAFPSSHWKGQPSDTPLRTVKTVLHTMAKHKGNKIMSHLSLIDNLQESEIEPYLQKVLKGGVRHRATSNAVVNEQNLAVDSQLHDSITLTRKDSRHSPRRLSKTTHEMLAEIFKKIGSKETTKEGLSDLYAFKKRHPEADIEPFLSKSSQFFQNYIEHGLSRIEVERGGGHHLLKQSQLSSSTGSIPSATVASMALPLVDAGAEPAFYLARLRELRTKHGMDGLEFESASRTMATSRATLSKAISISGSLELQSHGEMTTTMTQHTVTVTHTMAIPHSNSGEGLSATGPVDDLRRRLERIKSAAYT